MIIYNARILYGADFELIRGYIKVEDGLISEVGEGDIRGDMDAENCIIMPGLINAHVHLLDSIAKESGAGMTLDELVRPPNGYKQKILRSTPKAKLVAAARGAVREMISNGITYFCEFSNDPVLSKQANKEAKIYYEPTMVQVDDDVATNKPGPSIVDDVHGRAMECDGIGLSGVGEFSDATLEKIADLGLPLALHAAEHMPSQQRSLALTGKTEVERAVKLNPDFLVHVTNPLEDDVRHIVKKNIPIVCCPRCNALLGVGVPPIMDFLEKGVLVALGTDNVMLNSPDLFREMEFLSRIISHVHKDSGTISAKDILRMVTLNPAKILGLDSGLILEGKRADLLFLRPHRNMSPLGDAVSAIVHRADARNVWRVMCRGRTIYDSSVG
ncbi:MAG: amidohydrolase family protein [Methanosarcinales archaeon Met12]|nr:MAG: amidohydrolase family protein [Methanosarcinales archaeon Met12]